MQEPRDLTPGELDDAAGVSPSPNGDQTTSATESTEQEALCTICGLRACWQ